MGGAPVIGEDRGEVAGGGGVQAGAGVEVEEMRHGSGPFVITSSTVSPTRWRLNDALKERSSGL
jgi:hypothetical protein